MGGVKQSLYFPHEYLEEMKKEAKRQHRSISWIVQVAWRVARERLKEMPAATPIPEIRKVEPED